MPPASHSICVDTKVPPDPPKWALTPSFPPHPQTGPAAWGWTRRGLPLSARHRLHPQEPALHQRLRLSTRGLAARQPSCPTCPQLSITLVSLSLSVHVSISLPTPWPPDHICLSLPAPTLRCSAVSREPWHGPEGNGLVSFFQGTALPFIHREGEGTSRRVMCLVHWRWGSSSTPSQHSTGKWSPRSILPACSEQGVPLLCHLMVLKLNKSRWTSFFLRSFSVSPLARMAK